MNVRIKKKIRVIIILILTVICILIIIINSRDVEIKKEVDISAMGEEIPIKVISLNSNIHTYESHEIAYILGDRGNLYVLRRNSDNYYVERWHMEFWENIRVVDLCAEGKNDTYALALDREGNVYIWDKEYLVKEKKQNEYWQTVNVWDKKENWQIRQLEGIPKMSEIFATYSGFVFVTQEGEVYGWSPTDITNLNTDNMELIETEGEILNVVSMKDELLILDRNNVMWSIENGTKKVIKESVKNIIQGGKGFALQMMNAENEVYVCNIYLLQQGHDKMSFEDKYEVSKMLFEGNVSSFSVSDKTAVVHVDEEKYYRWGRRARAYIMTKLGYIATLNDEVYEHPVEVDLHGAKYYMLIGKDIVYVDDWGRLFVLIQKP